MNEADSESIPRQSLRSMEIMKVMRKRGEMMQFDGTSPKVGIGTIIMLRERKENAS